MKKNRIQYFLSLLLCLGLLLGLQPSLAQAVTGDISLSTPKTTVDGNERFLVSVKVDAPTGLYGVQLSLVYDDEKLNILNVSAGSAWPVSNTFVARATASGGGTDTESIEFAATLNDGSTLSGSAVELVSILIEAVDPTSGSTSTDISAGTTLPLLFSNAAGQSLAATAPGDLTITINPAPAVQGIVTLQSPGTGRTAAVTGIGSTVQGQDSAEVASGVGFSLALPTGSGFGLTAVAACHLTAEKSSVVSPSDGHTVTLIAGDVNGDNRVNIQDLAAMGNLFGSPPTISLPCTDLNQDGTVNILDLSRAASNYDKQGPTSW
ncbi:MAG: dockerin type I domain-containing protein [Caldilineaceae bacterium]